jgi:predicted nucleic acid-binding protein
MIALTGDVVGDLPVLRVVPLDPKDDVIVAIAIEAQAAYLVTGDRHLLALGSHSNIRMITPRQFLDLL